MLEGLSVFFGGSLPDETIAVGRFARRDRSFSMTPPPHESEADGRTFAVTPGILRLAAAGAIAANAQLPLMVLWKVTVLADRASLRYASLAAAATIVLHLRHVAFGLRDERPPAGAWMLAVLAIVDVAATVLVGRLWTVPFASLAVSVLTIAKTRPS